VESVNSKIIGFLKSLGIEIDFVYFCPHLPDGGCSCRKPEIGMLEKANKRIEISKNSLFYGDSDCDEDCAKNFGLKFIKMYN
jgi:HAD superfamily hydrolase (TIGR01662 family)